VPNITHCLTVRELASGAYFLAPDMNFFILNTKTHVSNHRSHKIVANKTYCAYYSLLQVDTDFERKNERDDVINAAPKTAFDRKATPRWVLNAIVTQISAALPTQRSSDQYASKRCVTVEDARAPRGSRRNDTRGR
jgi:hypothetical protein